ncbi:hypothetical protein BN1723_019795, partial [Verticillium longisporum]
HGRCQPGQGFPRRIRRDGSSRRTRCRGLCDSLSRVS